MYNGTSVFIVVLDFGVEKCDSNGLNQTINFGSIDINLRYYFCGRSHVILSHSIDKLSGGRPGVRTPKVGAIVLQHEG